MRPLKSLPFFYFLLLANLLLAQSPQPDSSILPVRSLKVPISDLVNPFAPAIMLSFEQRFAKRWSVMLEGGYVTSFNGRYFYKKTIYGYKMRAEIRRYFDNQNPNAPWYFGGQYMWRTSTTNQENGLFCKGNCPPNRKMEFNFDYFKRVQAIQLALGFLVKNQGKLIWDIEFFGGLRWRQPQFLGVPKGMKYVRNPNSFFDFRQEEADIWPSLGCAVRIGFQM